MRSKHLIPKHLNFDGWILPRVPTDGGGLCRSCQAAEQGRGDVLTGAVALGQRGYGQRPGRAAGRDWDGCW